MTRLVLVQSFNENTGNTTSKKVKNHPPVIRLYGCLLFSVILRNWSPENCKFLSVRTQFYHFYLSLVEHCGAEVKHLT